MISNFLFDKTVRLRHNISHFFFLFRCQICNIFLLGFLLLRLAFKMFVFSGRSGSQTDLLLDFSQLTFDSLDLFEQQPLNLGLVGTHIQPLDGFL